MATMVTHKRLRLGPSVWGLSARWLAICPWNGDEAWIQIPLIYFSIGTEHIELALGIGKWTINIDVRWRW